MTASGTFTCPACGADFDVQERLGGAQEPVARAGEEPVVADERPHEKAFSFQCPACGADYETHEELGEGATLA
jgi:predicted RNA-binding Zn-ribbon protein involved in translation (DUF1610 family)